MYRVSIKHNFESAHRLWLTSGKCHNVHGHSFLAEVTVAAPDVDRYGMIVDFGPLKREVRGMLDSEWDHSILLNELDPVADPLEQHGSSVTRLHVDPTTEGLARLLYDRVDEMLYRMTDNGLVVAEAFVESVHIQETAVNSAAYRP